MDLLLVALAAFVSVEFAKAVLDVFDQALHGWVKLACVLVVAGGAAALLEGDVADAVVLGLGGAGLAAVVHKAHRLLSVLGDAQVVGVMTRTTASRRRL